MSPNPNDTWVTSSIPGVVTPEQTALWQAGIQWFNATALVAHQGEIIHPTPSDDPTRNDREKAGIP